MIWDSKRLVFFCFFLSGMTALIYELVWTRWLVLIFGSTTFAISTILTSFMAGLALGSFLFGRMMVRRGNPLLVYALLEAAIGFYALLLPLFLPLIESLYGMVWSSLHLNFYAFSLVRFLLVGLGLMIPTTLMGATLPVMSRYLSKGTWGTGYTLGFLYFINTSGAILGCFMGGFILLPFLGLFKTTLFAVIINLLISIGILLIHRTLSKDKKTVVPEGDFKKDEVLDSSFNTPSSLSFRSGGNLDGSFHSKGVLKVILSSFAISGFSALVYEVAWTRSLSLVLGSSVYAFSAMLTTFLTGLAFGSFLSASIVERLKSPVLILAFVQLGAALAAYGTLLGLGGLPYWMVTLYGHFSETSPDLMVYLFPFIQFLLSFSVMFLPTLLLGMMFPIVARVYRGHIEGISRIAGDIYSINTLGAILGAFSGGFILIPVLGIQQTLLWIVGLNMLCGLVLFGVSPKRSLMSSVGVGAILLTGGVVTILFPPDWNKKVMSSGVFWKLPHLASQKTNLDRREFNQYLENQRELLFYREGISATVTVEKDSQNNALLKVNGRIESGSRLMRTQVLIAHIPLLLSQDPQNILVIGLGGGATLGSVTLYPVKKMKVVEIEEAIVEAVSFFDHENNRPLQDPRVEVVANDGRNYLLANPEQYDVIISQPSVPWMSGASNLFTQDFYRLGFSRLTQGGVFGQWFSSDVVGNKEYLSVLKAFRNVFPYVMIFQPLTGDILWVGSNRPLSFDFKKMEALFDQADISEDLGRVEVGNPFDLLSLYLGGPDAIDQFLDEAIPNTDNYNYVEFFGPYFYYGKGEKKASMTQKLFPQVPDHVLEEFKVLALENELELHQFFEDLASASLKRSHLTYAFSFINAAMGDQKTVSGHLLKANILDRFLFYDHRDKTRKDIIQLIVFEFEQILESDGTLSWESILKIAQGFEHIEEWEKAGKVYQKAVMLQPKSAKIQSSFGRFLETSGEPDMALLAYQKALLLNPAEGGVHTRIALQLLRKGEERAAEKHLIQAIQISPKDVDAMFPLADLYRRQGQIKRSILTYQGILSLDPNNYLAHNNLGNLYQGLGDMKSAVKEYVAVLRVQPDFYDAHLNLGVLYQRTGEADKAYNSYQNALHVNPLEPSLHYNMGFLFEEKGDSRRAEDSFQRFVALAQGKAIYSSQLKKAKEHLASLIPKR